MLGILLGSVDGATDLVGLLVIVGFEEGMLLNVGACDRDGMSLGPKDGTEEGAWLNNLEVEFSKVSTVFVQKVSSTGLGCSLYAGVI